MEEFNSTNNRHRITLINRKACTVSGVKDVLSFDLREVLLETDAGMLMLRGEDLHVSRLTLEKGEVDIDGRVDSLTYSEGGEASSGKESFFSRMFK